MKSYYIQHDIGTAKHVVNFHDGEKKHDDYSPFFDIAIFKSKKDLAKFTSSLDKSGYIPTH